MPPVWSGRVGEFQLDVLNIGDVTLPLMEAFRGPGDGAVQDRIKAALRGQRLIPLQDLLVRGDGVTVLVDAGAYDIDGSSSYAVPGYRPPPPLLDQLAALGVDASRIDHVVVTHRHWDHFNGLVRPEGALAFPHARVHIGRPDWEHVRGVMGRAATREARIFPELERAGRLAIVEREADLAPGISIIPAPGETRGHQVVRLHSSGETFYAVGDLYHHPIEVELSAWMVSWADPASNQASRARLLQRALPESARLMASHIPEVGTLRRTSAGAEWVSVSTPPRPLDDEDDELSP